MKIRNNSGDYVEVTELDDDDLHYWATKGKKAEYRDAARAELDRRVAEQATPPEPPHAKEVVELCGAIQDASEAAKRLMRMAQIGHLISPAPMVGSIPDGCALTVSAVLITNRNRETYPIKGSQDNERGLSRVILDKIEGAAGVRWIVDGCRRLDDGREPHRRHYQVAGMVQNFDLSWRTFTDQKVVDLSDGGPTVAKIKSRELLKEHEATEKGKQYQGDYGALEITGAREHIDSLCYTKARLRAIRSGLGLRQAYLPDELSKPFFIVRLAFTGQSADPEARREFRQLIGRSFFGDETRVGAAALLYGPGVVPALPTAAQRLRVVEASVDDDDGDDEAPPPRTRSTGSERY